MRDSHVLKLKARWVLGGKIKLTVLTTTTMSSYKSALRSTTTADPPYRNQARQLQELFPAWTNDGAPPPHAAPHTSSPFFLLQTCSLSSQKCRATST